MKTFHLIFLLFFTQITFSQSIGSYLSNLHMYDKYEGIEEIIEKTTFYNSDGSETEIEHKKFNSSMGLMSLQRFNEENKLIWLNLYKYDSLGRIVRIDNKKWINTLGYQTSYTIYEYDNQNNFIQIQYNAGNQPLEYWKYDFDDKQNLIQLANYDQNGNLYGYETAEYDVENNKMKVNVYDNRHNLKSSNVRPIKHEGEYKQKSTKKYNEHGDIIYWERNLNKDDNVCYTLEYRYDENGNWVSQKRYSYIKVENGKLKKKKLKVAQTRKIKLRK
ncbi:hypothetical protein [Aestuariivivens sp. NBU2969]|uniref:hypothetical protein n=1 Tax=Aestuariivivens sp. NBU2969 TaxID=2873267 RepID=UPI001CBEC8BB|nr:hypothetical protein [Aestuariivivens sp. NBU2969]